LEIKRKHFLASAFVGLLGLGIFLVWLTYFKEPTLEFRATGASANWLTYTSERNGFHIKYPTEGWHVNQFGPIASFSRETSEFSLSVRRDLTSVEDTIAQLQNELQGRGKIGVVKVSGFTVKRLQSVGGNFVGQARTDTLFFPGSFGTYEVSVSSAQTRHNERLKETALLNPVAREMIGTFGTDEIKQSDYLTYKDSRYHFSFTYPADWNLSFGEGTVSLRSFKADTDYWITLDAANLTSYIKWHGEPPKNTGEKQEHFAHRLLGWKYADSDKEGYYFEKDGNLYHIHIFRIKGPRKPIDDILNSFQF
jgi:hypothetical protein